MRHYDFIDRIIISVDAGINTVAAPALASRPTPGGHLPLQNLCKTEQRRSQGFMRVNHSGEVCAQALYRGQLVFAKSAAVRQLLKQAAIEETDHLAWTHQRLEELGSSPSIFNFFWYVNSFCIGLLVSRLGDSWSLGFVEETERQVSDHLAGHLDRLSVLDLRTREIVVCMQKDEEHHCTSANQIKTVELPTIVKALMRWHAKVLTTVAYYL